MSGPRIHNAMELEALVQQMGFLPFFACSVSNFSIEEFTPSHYWFVEGVDGPWEWRMEVACQGMVTYSKLFSKKTGLVSWEWYSDLANYPRNGYISDSRYEEDLASYREKYIADVLLREGPMLFKDLKRMTGFCGESLKGFDAVMTDLQMQTYVTVRSFEYARDKYGKPYGWGIARYTVMEDVLRVEVTQETCNNHSPEGSKARIVQHSGMLCPDAFDDDLTKLIR